MKVGVRKPNIKKRVAARTTGRVKRAAKGAVNPLYGKKGMGVVNDPKKAAYNAVYNRTTTGVGTENAPGSVTAAVIVSIFLAFVIAVISVVATGKFLISLGLFFLSFFILLIVSVVAMAVKK